jgi:hypothetical protein
MAVESSYESISVQLAVSQVGLFCITCIISQEVCKYLILHIVKSWPHCQKNISNKIVVFDSCLLVCYAAYKKIHSFVTLNPEDEDSTIIRNVGISVTTQQF